MRSGVPGARLAVLGGVGGCHSFFLIVPACVWMTPQNGTWAPLWHARLFPSMPPVSPAAEHKAQPRKWSPFLSCLSHPGAWHPGLVAVLSLQVRHKSHSLALQTWHLCFTEVREHQVDTEGIGGPPLQGLITFILTSALSCLCNVW